MWSLLDEMETDEVALVVLRYGRPAAMFIPFEENAMAPRMPRVADIEGLAAPEKEEPIDDVVLEPIQERIMLDMFRSTDLNWRINRVESKEPIGDLLSR